MTKLPEKDLLSGTKTPATTTGEMKSALGKLRDYLAELLGEDSSDKETARQALGIDLMQWAEKIEAKADPKDIESAIATKADKTELESRVLELEDAIAKRGIPVGSIEYFAATVPPAGYLKADGAAVGRETYPDLFAAIGTTFGEGDGETTFNLPDLIDRFAQGSNTPGQKIKAGLPNIIGVIRTNKTYLTGSGAFQTSNDGTDNNSGPSGPGGGVTFDASRSSPLYGASDTVQPPALTLLPCIKAFDAAVNPGLIDITELANDVAGKAEKDLSNAEPAQSFKDACLQWTVPDYTAGISITSEYVAPKAGFIGLIKLLNNNRSSLSINNVQIYIASVTEVWTQLDITFPVAKGDVITFSNTVVTFYPCRGA